MKTLTLTALILALAGPAGAQEWQPPPFPPVEFSPQLEVLVSEAGAILEYRYLVTIPATSTFNFTTFYLVPLRPLKELRYEGVWGATVLEDSRETHRGAITVVPSAQCKWIGSGPEPGMPGYYFLCINVEPNKGQVIPTFTLRSAHPAAVVGVVVKGDEARVRSEWERQAYPECNNFEDEKGCESGDDSLEYFGRAAYRFFYTLGPMGHQVRSWSHWEYFLESLAKAAELGWFPDAALHGAITDRAVRARQAAGAGRITEARALLEEAEALAMGATSEQLHRFGRLLVVTNADALRPLLPPRCQSELELDPQWQTFDVGREGVVTARVYNLADGQPIAGGQLEFRVLKGWQQGLTLTAVTDAQGEARFVVPAASTPKDLEYQVRGGIRPTSPESSRCGMWPVRKTGILWWDWPRATVDLGISEMIPPFVLSGPGREVMISERTGNRGTLPVEVPTVTRYFASVSEELDPAQAVVLGEREVEPLPGGGESDGGERLFVLPAGLPPGRIWLFACADATEQVQEYREDNNCGRTTGFLGLGVVPKLSITAHMPVGVVHTPYGGRLEGGGGWAPYRFGVIAGGLPPGLVLAEHGAITGVPGEAGSFTFTVRVTDELALEGEGEYTLTVSAAHGGAIPAVGGWGLWVLAALLAGAAAIGVWRGLRA